MRAVTAAVVKRDSKTPSADADALAREEADQAVAWLQRAVAAGYKNSLRIRFDGDFSVLRDREDFKKLLKELESRPAKK
jgi:hypothetical protein